MYNSGTSDPTIPSELKRENRDNSKMHITREKIIVYSKLLFNFHKL